MKCEECGTEFKRHRGYRSALCSVECRFLAKVNITDPDECWEWQAGDVHGYGHFSGNHYAHRFAYEWAVGPVPEGMQLDHLCRNRGCINPDHLEVVTPKVNTLRGMAPNIVTARTGICKRGHSMEDAIIKPSGVRTCRTCHNWRRSKAYVKVSNK